MHDKARAARQFDAPGSHHVDVFMLHNLIRAREPNIWQWIPLTPADVLDEVLLAMVEWRDAGLRGLSASRARRPKRRGRRVLESRQLG